jgi:hypothetical protein
MFAFADPQRVSESLSEDFRPDCRVF